jgi:hypothetical protein
MAVARQLPEFLVFAGWPSDGEAANFGCIAQAEMNQGGCLRIKGVHGE